MKRLPRTAVFLSSIRAVREPVARIRTDLTPATGFAQGIEVRDQRRVPLGASFRPAIAAANRLANTALGVKPLFSQRKAETIATINTNYMEIVQECPVCLADGACPRCFQ